METALIPAAVVQAAIRRDVRNRRLLRIWWGADPSVIIPKTMTEKSLAMAQTIARDYGRD